VITGTSGGDALQRGAASSALAQQSAPALPGSRLLAAATTTMTTT
jgi:hypothetical protein